MARYRKSNSNARKPKRTYRKRTAFSSAHLASKIKAISLKNAETKQSNHNVENLQLFHNRTAYRVGLLATSQGTEAPEGLQENSENRIGDEIIARGLKFKIWVANKVDRPNVMYKMFVYKYNTDTTAMSDAIFWKGTDGDGATMNRMIDSVNPMRIQLLKSFKIKPRANYSIPENAHENSKLQEFYIPLNNSKIKYRVDGGNRPLFKDIGFSICAYDSFGTLQTDNIASYHYAITLYFKDP